MVRAQRRRSAWPSASAPKDRSSWPPTAADWIGTVPGGSSAMLPAGPESTRASGRARCDTRSSPRRWTPGAAARCAGSRLPRRPAHHHALRPARTSLDRHATYRRRLPPRGGMVGSRNARIRLAGSGQADQRINRDHHPAREPPLCAATTNQTEPILERAELGSLRIVAANAGVGPSDPGMLRGGRGKGWRERPPQARARTMACKASPTAAPTTVPLMRMYCRSRPRSSSSWLDVSAASHRSIVAVTSPASSSWN